MATNTEGPAVNPADFSTVDMDFAAYEVARGIPLLRVEKAANGRSTFVFPATAQADLNAFYSGAMVRAIDFGGALRFVKKAMYDSKLYTTRDNNADASFNR